MVPQDGIQSANLTSTVETQSGFSRSGGLDQRNLSVSTLETINDSDDFFFLYEFANGDTPIEIRGTAAPDQPLTTVLPAETPFTLSLFYPRLNATAVHSGMTGAAGDVCPADIFTTHVGGFDFDEDGLSDIAEHIIGTAITNADTDQDGINDLAELQQGLDPLDNRGFPTGIISSLPLEGEANEIVFSGSTITATDQTAFIATGSHGLAIVDAGQFNNPIVLGQLDLPGNNTDVVVGDQTDLVFLASGGSGIHVVDVSDPLLPTLERTIELPGGANDLVFFDNLIYASSQLSTRLTVIDLSLIHI